MGIIQEKRKNAPQVSIQDTDYGAKYIKAATETKIEPEVVTLDEQKEAEEPIVKEKEVVETAGKPKKNGGRPKKAKR